MAQGALSLTQASTNKVTITNPLTFGAGTAFTYCQWVRQRAAPANSQGTDKGGIDLFVFVTAGSHWFAEIPRATTNALSTTTNATVFPDTLWCCLFITYDETNGVKIYRGTQSVAVAEVSYDTGRTVGSGNTTADSGNLVIGNRSGASALAPAHDIGMIALFGAVLTTTEMQSWLRRPRLTVGSATAACFGRAGKNGADWIEYSGKSTTVTGGAQADGPALLQTLPSMMRAV